MSDEKRTEGEPHDRLTRIADRCAKLVEYDPEFRKGSRCIIFLNDGDRAGVGLFGYDSDTEAVADMLIHIRGVLRANGKDLRIHALRGGELS
jgi:hypothetical protein